MMDPQARRYFLNIVLAFVPDLIVCWAAARLTDSGWYGFFITLIALQAIYFFFWFKNALWAWLLFWIYGKQKAAAHLESWFIDCRLPAPDKYITDLDDYLSEISNNAALDADTRVKAAHELGTLNGLKTARKFSMLLQINSAAKIALKRLAMSRARNRKKLDDEIEQLCQEISTYPGPRLTTEDIPQRFPSREAAQAFGETWSRGGADSFSAKAVDAQGRIEGSSPGFDKTSISSGILFSTPALFFGMRETQRDDDAWWLDFLRAKKRWLEDYRDHQSVAAGSQSRSSKD
jgi:hypothetical protein